MAKMLNAMFRRIFAGFVTVLPIIVTVFVAVWLVNFLGTFLGPDSVFGRVISRIGLTFLQDRTFAYGIGLLAVLFSLYLIGLAVMSALQARIGLLLDRTIGRIPLVGSVYALTNRFIAIFDHKDDMDIKSMSPVWCFFGGEEGASVLALMPTAEPVFLNGHEYRGILIPSAPIPFGGGLVFVPISWVKPADFGVEALTNIYISMGLTAPQYQGSPETEGPMVADSPNEVE